MNEIQEVAKKKTKTTWNSPYDNEVAARRGVAWTTRCDPEKEVTCGLCKEGESLNRQIHDMEEALTTLKAIRASKNTNINTVHDPLTCLPIELVSEIFMYLRPLPMQVAYSRGEGPNDVTDSFKNPLLLGAVCKAWRAFAWSIPRLWSTISVNVYNGNEGVPDIIRQWLERSGQLPLSMYLYAVPLQLNGGMITAEPHGDEPFVEPLLAVINGCSGRWYHLNLDIPKCFILRVHCSGSEAPMLETLTLQMVVDDMERDYLKSHERIKIGPTPNLKRIHCSPTITFEDIDMDWASVLHAEFPYFPIELCGDLLRQAPILTHLTLRQLVVDELLPSSTFRHQNLVSLQINPDGNGQNGPSALLPYLDLPALEDLVTFVTSKSDFDILSSFLQHSCTALKKFRLIIYGMWIESQRELITLLAKMPCLEILDITCAYYQSPDASESVPPLPLVIQQLEPINENLFLPKLERICIKVGSSTESIYAIELLLRPDGLNMVSPRRPEHNHVLPSEGLHLKPSHLYYLLDIATQRFLQPMFNSNFEIKLCAQDLSPFIDFLQQSLIRYADNAGVRWLSGRM